MKKIVIASFAGGVGKTTTAHSCATAMSEYGKKTVLIDADPNASLTFLTGIENPRFTLREVLAGSSLESSVVSTGERFSFLPSSARLNEIAEFKELLDTATFDIALIDTASSLSAICVELIKSADRVVIPVTETFISIRSALHIKDFLGTTAASIIRILDCGLSVEAKLELSKEFTILEPKIRRDTTVGQNELSKVSVLTSAPKSDIASDYREVSYSILEELGMI